MKLYLAGTMYGCQGKALRALEIEKTVSLSSLHILESFMYVDEDTEYFIPHLGDFMLDSGAFTFMTSKKDHALDLDEYVERYADFITRNDIQKYFELDVDSIVGYSRVKELRKKLEDLTGRPSIPVWHVSRGVDEFKCMCDEYSYVAVGGIASKEISLKQYHVLPALIKEAHRRRCKIHGLGFTALKWLPRCHFDSVDSTAWTTGNRFGYVHYFDGRTIKITPVPPNFRLRDAKGAAFNNFIAWAQFSRYAETHL